MAEEVRTALLRAWGWQDLHDLDGQRIDSPGGRYMGPVEVPCQFLCESVNRDGVPGIDAHTAERLRLDLHQPSIVKPDEEVETLIAGLAGCAA
jgi:hypothetical protein